MCILRRMHHKFEMWRIAMQAQISSTLWHYHVLQFLSLKSFKIWHGKFVANSMNVYAQPKYSNFPTFDSLNCGTLWFQVS